MVVGKSEINGYFEQNDRTFVENEKNLHLTHIFVDVLDPLWTARRSYVEKRKKDPNRNKVSRNLRDWGESRVVGENAVTEGGQRT